MPIGRMLLWSWILFGVFLVVAVGVAPALGGGLIVPVAVIAAAACVASFVYGMYLSLRVVRNGDPRLLTRGTRGTAIILAAKETNTQIQEGEFAWQAPFVWKYHLRVSLPDRQPYETDCSICAANMNVGDTVNVAAAPHNKKRVTIDVGQGHKKQSRHEAQAQQASQEDALRTLVERHERGELTDDEFETQKRQLLS